MTRQSYLLLGLLVALVAWGGWTIADHHSTPPHNASTPRPKATAIASQSIYSPDELRAFLDAAEKADGIADLLQRCLQYPDLPGSHWQHETVAAYCRYLFQPHLSYVQIRQYIQSNNTDKLEKQLQQALQAQVSQPDSQGVLDRIYVNDFCGCDGQTDTRQVVDDWIRHAPYSAFAYAASGWTYIGMAFQARGAAFAQYTAEYRLDDMDALLQKAKNDFKKAMAINPRIMAIYTGMIGIGGMTGDYTYMGDATHRAMQIDSSDLWVYMEMLRMGESKWAGSPATMQAIGNVARSHQSANPLLAIIPVAASAYVAKLYDNCDCDDPSHTAPSHQDDRKIFDSLPSAEALVGTGEQTWFDENATLTAVYLTEALRFAPYDARALASHAAAVAVFGYRKWALAEGQRAQNLANGNDAWLLGTIGQMFEGLKDYPDAEQALQRSHQVDPTDNWSLRELGRIYVYNTHEWDKGWSVADQLISVDPNDAMGWVLRASIQKDQPRPGMDDTIHYFLTHFGNDPKQQQTVREMRQILAKEAKARAS
jgi:tetratricopeptide (TPR) repeat protein